MAQEPSGRLAQTYSLIYQFLATREHFKAAKAVKKAAKGSDITINKTGDGTSLETVVYEWKELSVRNQELEELKEHLLGEIAALVAAKKKKKKNLGSESGSTSESGESTSKSSESSSSSSSTSSDDDEPKKTAKPAVAASLAVNAKKIDAGKTISASQSKNDRSISSATTNTQEEEEVATTVLAPPTPQIENPQPFPPGTKSPSDSSSPCESDDTEMEKIQSVTEQKVTKKRKLDNGSKATAVEQRSGEKKLNQNEVKPNVSMNGAGKRRTGVPFQRIKADKIEVHDERLMDNSFVARGVGRSDYGAKAHEDLVVTKGAGFRKEKNKKKRGSYRGGEITMQSHSIKFE